MNEVKFLKCRLLIISATSSETEKSHHMHVWDILFIQYTKSMFAYFLYRFI
jgi:hypothetical protein